MKIKNLQYFFPYGKNSHQWPQVFAIFIASLTSLTCGAQFTWTSPSIPILISNSSQIDIITLEQASYFTVIPPISASIAAPISAYAVDILGRRNLVIFLVVPQLSAWILIAFAENIYVLYVSRLLTGIGDALVFTALPMYVSEISEPRVRGSWGNLVAINRYLGQCLINVIGAYCTITTTALIFSVLPIICAVMMLLLPESPYFYLMKGREKDAEASLQKLKWQKNVDDDLVTLKNDVKRQISESGTLKDLFIIPVNRKALLISIAIRGAQQLSGLPAFASYTQYIFNLAGGDVPGKIASIIYSTILFVTISLAGFFVDKFGRRKLMTFSCLACALILASEATYFYIDKETTIDTSGVSWMPLAGMLIFIFTCSSGLGIIPTLMLGELFSASVKSKALCIVQICFSMYVIFVSKMFQTLTANFGIYVPFVMFSCCCFVSTVFSYFFVPETKGKTLEEIQQTLKKRSNSKEISK